MNIVMNLAGMPMSPDFFGIVVVRRSLEIDQQYYPERLNRLFVINAPWFFTAIYALVSPWIDPITAKKIVIVGSDYMDTLLESIDISQIPEQLGGNMQNVTFSWPYPESSGVSPEQLQAHAEKYFQLNTTKEDNDSTSNSENA
jgi:hypothetical protein